MRRNDGVRDPAARARLEPTPLRAAVRPSGAGSLQGGARQSPNTRAALRQQIFSRSASGMSPICSLMIR